MAWQDGGRAARHTLGDGPTACGCAAKYLCVRRNGLCCLSLGSDRDRHGAMPQPAQGSLPCKRAGCTLGVTCEWRTRVFLPKVARTRSWDVD